MSVKKRGSKYHYRFSVDGKGYNGVCKNCTNLAQAEAYEKKIREEVTAMRKFKTVTALVDAYRYELSGGAPVTLDEACELQLKKPTRRPMTKENLLQRRTYWNDFRTFLRDKYPELKNLSDVRRIHCEEYVGYLTKNGRYVQDVSYQLGKKTVTYRTKGYRLSPRTIGLIAENASWVFKGLSEDAGLSRNPWDGVILPEKNPVSREVFTEDELNRIRIGIQGDDFCKPLFTVAAVTGLTEGDICTLKWSEIHWIEKCIIRYRRKTKVLLEIPIMGQLEAYLRSLPRVSEYVFPEHAKLYLETCDGVSYRIGNFLTSLGIKTTVSREGMRDVSVKDLHSMRHVFCYYAGAAGIPLPVVQSIVGHLTPEMTRHYMRHSNHAVSQREIERLPGFLWLGDTASVDTGEADRKKLSDLVQSLPIGEVREILNFIQGRTETSLHLPA
jgi:integrase